MIRALMLIFDPTGAWERIEADPKNAARILFLFLLPLMLICYAVEYWGLRHFGVERSSPVADLPARHASVSSAMALRYEGTQFALSLIIVFGGAFLFQKIGESFHRRHSYTETFTTLAYSISPLLLSRMLAGLPHLNTWVCWGIGVSLSVAVLYRGIPRIMKPDPSNALGLYLLCSLVLIALTGLAHLLAILVLDERVLAG